MNDFAANTAVIICGLLLVAVTMIGLGLIGGSGLQVAAALVVVMAIIALLV